MGKKSRKPKSVKSGSAKQIPAAAQLPPQAYHNDPGSFYMDNLQRPYQEWFGQTLILSHVQSPLYRDKKAYCVGYSNTKDRLIVWPLETANEVLVEPIKCTLAVRYTVLDCCKEIRTKQQNQPTSHNNGNNDNADDDHDSNNTTNLCTICNEELRAPVELPCKHIFCASCIARLRNPRELGYEVNCPTCHALLPAMFEKQYEMARFIMDSIKSHLVCSDRSCQKEGRHERYQCLLIPESLHQYEQTCQSCQAQKDIIDLLLFLENMVRSMAMWATVGHKMASKVKAHRTLMRECVCKFLPSVQKLRRQFEGCLQIRATCGGIDTKLEELFQTIHGEPLYSPEEQKTMLQDKPSNFNSSYQVTSKDEQFTSELTKLVLKEFDASWYYIRSFGRHYDRILNGFANSAGYIANDSKLCRILTEQMAVDQWTMRRLDALEDLLSTKQGYGKYEATECYHLLQLLFNVIFVAVGETQMQLDLFVRCFGQEYFLRELEGGIDLKLRHMLHQTVGKQLYQDVGYTDEYDRPLLLLRPCATTRQCGGSKVNPNCQTKEYQPKTFLRCPCKRRVYCSPLCKMFDEEYHAAACQEALNAQKRLAGI